MRMFSEDQKAKPQLPNRESRSKSDSYEDLYKKFHSNPELSGQESATAELIAEHLRFHEAFTIHEKIGGHGIAAVLRNGPGKTILLRADIDALPILEQTDLPYASKKTQKDKNGIIRPVMHACGHDTHIVSLLAAAGHLAITRSSWSGSLVLVFQPAEENGQGAQAMVDDGLYSRFGIPIPDIVLGQHVGPFRGGNVTICNGVMLGAADSFKITFFGRGGHGSAPDKTIDPIVMASSAVLRLQTIVSREINPKEEEAVVTVGSIQAGQAENIIPDQAVMLLNIRTIDEKTREKVLASVRRIVKAEADASGAIQPPTVEQISRFPLTRNDQVSTERLIAAFEKTFGSNFDSTFPGSSASEDFSILATAIGKPYIYWAFGGIDPDIWDDAVKNGKYIAGNHTPFFAPCIQPTLKTGTDALCTAALTFF
ncbi:Hippurate hydrolase [Lachnellula suecica]|uniref:Hippurate hydrolase n=1 Tax=Lachnellula suecica TaxID=602035 RepID=A0A8T9CH31_9HELO|nr:Hippurate hydrolase [Lachnellula suecica]